MPDKKKINMFFPNIAETAVARMSQVLTSRWIGQGAIVDEFENVVKEALRIPHAVALNSASSAIRLALAMCDVGPGDEVISTPMACTMTNQPVLEQFATVVFADIQYDSGNIDPEDIEHRITEKTKAIVCTHWAGQPADLDEIHDIARRHDLPVVEDASEAFGARYKGRSIGAISPFTAFSFQATQMITTGEGGMLAVLDESHLDCGRTLRFSGIDRIRRKPNLLGYFDFDITSVGYCFYMTNLSAALGIENLKTLEMQMKHRMEIVERYRTAFEKVPGITLLTKKNDREPSYHFFTMHVQQRENFCRKLKERDIEVSIVHDRNDIYTVFGGRRELPGLDRFHASYIGLPTHMQLSLEEADYIIDVVKSGW